MILVMGLLSIECGWVSMRLVMCNLVGDSLLWVWWIWFRMVELGEVCRLCSWFLRMVEVFLKVVFLVVMMKVGIVEM